MRLQAALRPSTITHGSGPSPLPACRIRPSRTTQSVLALAVARNQIFLHATGFRSFPSRATTPAVVQCSTMPRDMENCADVKLADASDNGWKIKMLYDGECPLCMREVNMLRERNKNYGDAIKFVDICADDYAAEENSNIDFETAMGRIHAIRKDGEILTNIAAFRALYEEIGLGWVYAITYHQPWASILDAVYEFWAKYRLPVTGRPALVEVLEKRRRRKVEGGKINADEQTRCRLD